KHRALERGWVRAGGFLTWGVGLRSHIPLPQLRSHWLWSYFTNQCSLRLLLEPRRMAGADAQKKPPVFNSDISGRRCRAGHTDGARTFTRAVLGPSFHAC